MHERNLYFTIYIVYLPSDSECYIEIKRRGCCAIEYCWTLRVARLLPTQFLVIPDMCSNVHSERARCFDADTTLIVLIEAGRLL